MFMTMSNSFFEILLFSFFLYFLDFRISYTISLTNYGSKKPWMGICLRSYRSKWISNSCIVRVVCKKACYDLPHTKKKKTLIDVEIINEKFYKTFKNIIALQDVQIIYLSWHFLFPPFFFHLNLDSIKIANFSIIIFFLSSKNFTKKKNLRIF